MRYGISFLSPIFVEFETNFLVQTPLPANLRQMDSKLRNKDYISQIFVCGRILF